MGSFSVEAPVARGDRIDKVIWRSFMKATSGLSHYGLGLPVLPPSGASDAVNWCVTPRVGAFLRAN